MENIGKVIKKVRKTKALTQKDLSLKIGVSISYISHIEKGKRNPGLDVIEKIGLALEVPLPILFFLTLNQEDKTNREILEMKDKVLSLLKIK